VTNDAQRLVMHTAAERPDLWERGIPSDAVWPEYMLHGDVLNQWWGHLDEELRDYQFVLYDEANDLVVAEGHTGPMRWDGMDASLPESFDAAIVQVFAEHRAGKELDTLCALAAESPHDARRRGLAVQLLEAMRELAERHGLTRMVAPVRPSAKERYPLTPIERYITWRRDDGQLLDPWMRVHERLGARVATPLPRSLHISGSVADWESWTEMAFPESDDYVFPEGLAPVHIDRQADLGDYWEPNVWMVHPELLPAA
jgi:GNAT superfamily N-acetyltransferase